MSDKPRDVDRFSHASKPTTSPMLRLPAIVEDLASTVEEYLAECAREGIATIGRRNVLALIARSPTLTALLR